MIPYCDGTFHEGTRKAGIDYKNTTLYFRGSNNTLTHFDYLNKTYGLFNANKIIISGVSAGGIATFIWANYLLEQSVNKNVYSIPDSGIFISSFVDNDTDSIVSASLLLKLVNS